MCQFHPILHQSKRQPAVNADRDCRMSTGPQQNERTAPPSQPPSSGRGRRLLVVAAAGLASAAIVMLPRSNSTFAAAYAAILAVVAAAIIDRLFFRPRRFLLLRLALACLIGGGIGSRLQLTDAIAFRRAFGCEPPAAVRSVVVHGHYLGSLAAGPPSDIWVLIQFSADDGTFQRLVSHRSFQRDEFHEKWWQEERATVWRQLFGGFAGHGGPEWQNVELPKNVQILWWRGDPIEGTTVLWDQDTGRAYVLYGYG